MSYLRFPQEEEDDLDLNDLALTGDDIPFSTDSVKAQFAIYSSWAPRYYYFPRDH